MTFLAHASIILVCVVVVLIVAFSLAQLTIIGIIRERENIRKAAAQEVAETAVKQYNAAMESFRGNFMGEFNKMGTAYLSQMNDVVKQAETKLMAVVKQAAESAAGKRVQ